MKKNSLNMAQTRLQQELARLARLDALLSFSLFCLTLIVSVAYKSFKSKMHHITFSAVRFEAMVLPQSCDM